MLSAIANMRNDEVACTFGRVTIFHPWNVMPAGLRISRPPLAGARPPVVTAKSGHEASSRMFSSTFPWGVSSK
jgi:hypothetical protein